LQSLAGKLKSNIMKGNRGGARPNAGPKPKSPLGKKFTQLTFRLSPEAAAVIESLPRGTKADYINNLITRAGYDK